MEGSSLSPFLAVRGNVDSTWTRAPQSPSALSASSHLLAPADASGDLAGVRRQSARRASPSAPRNPSQDTSLLPQARGCFPKFFLPPEQGRRPSTSAVCPAAPPRPPSVFWISVYRYHQNKRVQEVVLSYSDKGNLFPLHKWTRTQYEVEIWHPKTKLLGNIESHRWQVSRLKFV